MRFCSIKNKIFIYICTLTSLSILITCFIMYSQFMKIFKENESEILIRSSNKVKQELEFFLRFVDTTGTSLASNEDLLHELSAEYNPLDNNYTKSKNKLNLMLHNMVSAPGYIKGIYVVGPKGNLYTNDDHINETALRQFFELPREGKFPTSEYYTSVHKTSYTQFSTSDSISYIRPIFNVGSEENLGMIIIDINYDYLKELFTISSIQSEEKVLIISEKAENLFTFPYNINLDNIIKDNQDILSSYKSTYSKKVFGKDSLIVSTTIDYSNWKMIRIIPLDKIYNDIQPFKTTSVIVAIIFIFLSLLASIILSTTLTKPIKELNNSIKLIENGNLNINVKVKRNDELGELSNSFNNMALELKKLIGARLEDQKKKSSMEFEILQAQINPHFLYNTLDSIKWLAVIQQAGNIADMTTALINLLKYNISKNDNSVTLREEIDSIINYIKIQKYRYGEIFTVKYHLDERTLDIKVLRFILQPIVENAIFHGFENTIDNGVIDITSKIIEEKLLIEIEDNGVGIGGINANISIKELSSKGSFNGIGLRNINDRIKLYFGEEYGMTVISSVGNGTKVSLLLPLLTSDLFKSK